MYIRQLIINGNEKFSEVLAKNLLWENGKQ